LPTGNEDQRASFVAQRFGLPEPTDELRPAHRGAVGQIYCLQTAAARFAVKEFFWSAAEADIVRETQFRDVAVRHGVRAAENLRTTDGAYLARFPDEMGGKYVRVYTWVNGVQETGPEVGIWLAGMLGRLHAIGYPAEGEVDPWYWKPPTEAEIAELIERSERANGSWSADLRNARPRMLELAALVSDIDRSRLIMCHRDMQAQNVLRTDEGRVLVDWDDVGPALPDWELAAFLRTQSRAAESTAIVGDLVAAYRTGGGTATISSLDQFTWLIASPLNYVKAQVEVAVDTTGSMREFAVRELDRALAGLPTVAELTELQKVAARHG
jgi:Ser/Thr protein kinase RdoA (MazF antagonist)